LPCVGALLNVFAQPMEGRDHPAGAKGMAKEKVHLFGRQRAIEAQWTRKAFGGSRAFILLPIAVMTCH
jgi:hypothetical protein